MNDDGNRLLTIRSGLDPDSGPLLFSFVHDDNGNLEERRDGGGALLQSFVYDQKNRATSITTGSETVSFGYDTGDYRITKSGPSGTAWSLLEGEHLEAVYDETGTLTTKYLRGVVIDEIVNGYLYDAEGTATNYTFHHDRLQSVVGVSGHTGSVEETVYYAPFGEEIAGSGSSPNLLRYTGRLLDPDTGLYYYRARYYDPVLGRFLSEDPLRFAAGVNFYTYVENNPVNRNDPYGEDFKYLGVQASAGAGGGGSVQVAVARDPEGNWWNPGDYYVMTTEAAGGHGAIDFSVQGVGGYSTADHPTDLVGGSRIVGFCGGEGIVGGVEVVFGKTPSGVEYQSYEGSVGYGLGIPPVNFHGYGATTQVQTVPEFIDSLLGTDLFHDSGYMVDAGNAASGGFVLYPSKPNTNMANAPYIK